MGKKKNHSAPAAAESSKTKAIDDLKALNDQLVKEVTKCRKQIVQLQFQLAALASHHSILVPTGRDSLVEAPAQDKAEMTVKKVDFAAAQLEASEMRLLAVVREKDEIQNNMERIVEEKDCTIRCLEQSLKQSRKKLEAELAGGRKWKRWISSFVVAVLSFSVIAVAVANLCCSKSSNSKF